MRKQHIEALASNSENGLKLNTEKLFLLLIIVFVYAVIQPASADICETEKNVKDYYLSIPPEYLSIWDDLKGPLETKAELEAAIDVLDIQNGYLVLQNRTIISRVVVVLYRDSERRPIILITQDGTSVQNIAAFNCYDDEWHNVSKSIFPDLSPNEVYELYQSTETPLQGGFHSEKELLMAAHTLIRYELPRVGRTITAIASHPNTESARHVLFEFEPDFEHLTWE